jgi:hypothetical protein
MVGPLRKVPSVSPSGEYGFKPFRPIGEFPTLWMIKSISHSTRAMRGDQFISRNLAVELIEKIPEQRHGVPIKGLPHLRGYDTLFEVSTKFNVGLDETDLSFLLPCGSCEPIDLAAQVDYLADRPDCLRVWVIEYGTTVRKHTSEETP